MQNPRYWRATLFGVVIIVILAAALMGCQPEGEAQPPINPEAIETPAPDSQTTDPRITVPIENQLPPAGAEEGHIGNPDVVPDMSPRSDRDPDWDCTPTGNSAIDTWKREAKCGGKLDGE